MRVLKIEAEGVTTAFRYPFFMAGRHPTFEMPPPATIYGHICSAVGAPIDPASLRFAYWFTHSGSKATDLEHFLSTEVTSARSTFTWSPRSSATVHTVAKNIEATVQPVQHEFLCNPRLTLYLSNLDLAPAFRSPRYVVVLGRSQDLFAYTRVSELDLVAAPQAYVEATILPAADRSWLKSGVTLAMPRYIDYSHQRQATFGQYLMVQRRVAPEAAPPTGTFWIDPESASDHTGRQRAVIFHDFVDSA